MSTSTPTPKNGIASRAESIAQQISGPHWEAATVRNGTIERIDQLETETQHLRAQLRVQRNQQKGTKKERAKRLARNEVFRQIAQGTNPIGEGGAVDVPIVITTGHGLGVEFTHKTVGDASQALTTEWECFKLQDDSGTKEEPNKRLVAPATTSQTRSGKSTRRRSARKRSPRALSPKVASGRTGDAEMTLFQPVVPPPLLSNLPTLCYRS